MPSLRVLTAVEQVASHLREEIFRRSWAGQMPGSDSLAKELWVGHTTIEGALASLEKEGLLVPQGTGRRRLIVLPENAAPPGLRIAHLEFDPPSQKEGYFLEALHALTHHGHRPFFTERTLVELDMDVTRIARMVNRTEADVWVVGAGPRKVLEWFAVQGLKTFSIFGAPHGLPIAAIVPAPEAMLTGFRRLLELGHRRIVFLAFRGRKRENPGPILRALLGEMESRGIPTGPYTIPGWEDTAQGFRALLESLFAHTPPTAILVEEPPHFFAALQFCGARGLRVPQDVSLMCMQVSPDFDYCAPAVTHCRWDDGSIIRRLVRWADNVARGKEDRRISLTKVEFVEGGTIGPARP